MATWGSGRDGPTFILGSGGILYDRARSDIVIRSTIVRDFAASARPGITNRVANIYAAALADDAIQHQVHGVAHGRLRLEGFIKHSFGERAACR